MAVSPETLVGATPKGVFAPPAGSARAAQTTVQFEVLRFVGAGKFAWVYEARTLAGPPGLARRVAIKILYRDDGQAVRRFQREIKVMRQLPSHPNNVGYLGHGTLDKHPWVAMDFVDGFTLGAVLRAQRPISEHSACSLMAQLCDGFEGLHRLGLTHRDITPDNIMLTQQERQVKLMDFGLVQDSQGLLQLYEQVDIVDGADFRDDLDAGLIAGTPEFMAPEQILDPHEKDRRRQRTDTTADVFALGTIFYQLVSGTQLFPYEKGARGATGKQALINYLDYRVKLTDDALTCPVKVGPALWSIIRKSLLRDPRQRQRDASELGADIRYYLETGEGVLEDDLSATIATELDAQKLRALASAGMGAALGLDFGPRDKTTPPSHANPMAADVPSAVAHSPLSSVRPDAPLSRATPRAARDHGGAVSEKRSKVDAQALPEPRVVPSKIKESQRAQWLGTTLLVLGAVGLLGLGALIVLWLDL
jgi:serine/threonine protein kinase